MKYELLSGGEVVNTIEAEPEYMADNYQSEQYREVVEAAPAPAAPTWTWYIDKGPFFDRFGAAKIAVLTSADSVIKALLADINNRHWIDLQRADLVQAVAYIGTKVPAVDAALQTAILTTPVAEAENLALRRLFFY